MRLTELNPLNPSLNPMSPKVKGAFAYKVFSVQAGAFQILRERMPLALIFGFWDFGFRALGFSG